MKRLVIFAALVSGCATTPQGKLHQGAKLQKVGVDGLGNTYLDVCEQLIRPRCVADNAAAKGTDDPWDEEDRIACLTPCNADNAEKIKRALDVVIAAQLTVFAMLKAGGSSPEQLANAQSELRDAAERLLKVLDDTGATDFLAKKLYGG